MELFCIRPAGCSSASFEVHVRRAVERLGDVAQIGITWLDPQDAGGLGGIPPCSCAPTLFVVVRGRVMAQAVGDLPPRELKDLMATALRNRGAV